MKHTLLNRLTWLLFFTILVGNIFTSCCSNEIHGTFYIDDEARKYMPDTTIRHFKMLDQNGITDGFYIDETTWYKTHIYMSEWGSANRCGDASFSETFGVAYSSTMNGVFMMIVLRANPEGTELELEWNQTDRVNYNFLTKEISSEKKPSIQFIDNMEIKGKTYTKVILFDFRNILQQISYGTPKQIYIAEKYGLIKYVSQMGSTFEREI